MDRRKSLKIIAGTAVAGGAMLAGCGPAEDKKVVGTAEPSFTIDRNPDELKYEKSLLAREKFFTEHEMATISVLADIIIPKDEVSGSATEAQVPEFISFIVQDMPNLQTPLRGGLRWLDLQSLKQFDRSFIDCTSQQQITMVDQIAYPDRVKPGMEQGVAFFSQLRNLVASGFYTTAIGMKDLGYEQVAPHQWNGVPDDVLKQYNMAYTEKELKECVSFDKPA
jgi:hypothetical protein